VNRDKRVDIARKLVRGFDFAERRPRSRPQFPETGASGQSLWGPAVWRRKIGGEAGIRTLGTRESTTVFEFVTYIHNTLIINT